MDSVVNRFECTYSLVLEMIRRCFEVNGADNADTFAFNYMIRNANECSLLLTVLEKRDDYRIKRNITSHTYDDKKAEELCFAAEDFCKDVSFPYKEPGKRNNRFIHSKEEIL